MTPGNFIAVGAWVAGGAWLGWKLIGGAAWVVGRAQREVEERLWLHDQHRLCSEKQRCLREAEAMRIARAREDLERFETEEDRGIEEAFAAIESLRFFHLEDWAA